MSITACENQCKVLIKIYLRKVVREIFGIIIHNNNNNNNAVHTIFHNNQ